MINKIDTTVTEGLFVNITPEKRVYGNPQGGPKEYTYILDITNPLINALEKNGVSLSNQIILPTSSDSDVILLKKNELHLTCIGFGHTAIIRSAAEQYDGGVQAFKEKVSQILSEVSFSFTINLKGIHLVENKEYNPEDVKVAKSFESERTIILDINTTGIMEFYQRMRDELGVDLGASAAHVTLYIQNQEDSKTIGLGIAIYDIEQQQKGPSNNGPFISVRKISLLPNH